MSSSKKIGYRHTVSACFLGYICQAIIVNFAPLLFLTFAKEFSIPMSNITVLITANFGFQLLTDLISPKFVDKMGYKAAMILAHALCSAGLIMLAVLPDILGFAGLLIPTVVYGVGGGLLEVIVSPIIESCPMDKKKGALSLLHSFYCWGVVLTVLLSTAFFAAFGVERWRVLSLLWAILPILNLVFITLVPMPEVPRVEKGKSDLGTILKSGVFYVFIVMMLSSGASEMAIQQWASTFAESALGVGKTLGDLLGVCGFSFMMALARTIFGKFSERLPLRLSLAISSLAAVVCYLAIVFIKTPEVGFTACILCGFAVGIFWPGTFTLATATLPCTTSTFALLSLAGDVGCTVGPTLTGLVSDAFGGDFRMGILAATVFPLVLIVGAVILLVNNRIKKK